jgi:hypothetical protein
MSRSFLAFKLEYYAELNFMNSEYYMCETGEGILQLSMLILLYKTELPAVLYCIGSPLVAVSFKVLKQV